jgi:choline dehydrogenase-like flavoprotein
MAVPRLVAYSADPAAPGRKQSMSETLVPRFLAAGGRLLAETRVRHIARQDGRWRLWTERADGGAWRPGPELEAGTLFVACGAVQTPALLRRSGITRAIGDTLRFHPMIKVVAMFADEVNQSGGQEPVHQIKEFDPRFSMGCSVSKWPALALAMADHPEHLAEVDRNWRRMAIYYAQTTGGRAAVRPLPWFRDPLVRALHDPQDLQDLAAGLRRLCECLFAAGAVAIWPGTAGLGVLRAEADLRTLPEALPPDRASMTALHLFSSCPMGEDEARCATDSFGRVRGVEGLHIADASLLCGPTVVNPQGTVMAVAHRNARHFLDSGGGRPISRTFQSQAQRSRECVT